MIYAQVEISYLKTIFQYENFHSKNNRLCNRVCIKLLLTKVDIIIKIFIKKKIKYYYVLNLLNS